MFRCDGAVAARDGPFPGPPQRPAVHHRPGARRPRVRARPGARVGARDRARRAGRAAVGVRRPARRRTRRPVAPEPRRLRDARRVVQHPHEREHHRRPRAGGDRRARRARPPRRADRADGRRADARARVPGLRQAPGARDGPLPRPRLDARTPGSYLPLREHVSLDPQAAEGLALAVRARYIVGLPAGARRARPEGGALDRQQRVLHLAAPEAQPVQLAGGHGARRRQRVRRRDAAAPRLPAVPHALPRPRPPARARTARRTSTTAWASTTCRTSGPTSPSNRVGTSEYANIVFHALDDYAPALAAGMPPLDEKRMWVLRSWARRILTGDWTHAGYLNWDTGPRLPALAPLPLLGLRARRPEHARRGARPGGAASSAGRAGCSTARWATTSACRPGARSPRSPRRSTASAPRRPTRSPTRSSSPPASPGLVAHQALARAVDAPAEQPPPLFAYDPGSRRLAVTTPTYSAAVARPDDPARLRRRRPRAPLRRPRASARQHRQPRPHRLRRRDHPRATAAVCSRRRAATAPRSRFRSGKPLRGAFTTRTMTATRQGPPAHVGQASAARSSPTGSSRRTSCAGRGRRSRTSASPSGTA